MPNWCSNWIVISGDEKKIKTIKFALQSLKDNKDDNGIFKALIGTKPGISKENYDNGGWYDANLSFWGTKWDISYDEVNFNFDDKSISFSGDTAWSPPIEFAKELARTYGVDVELQYSESGNDFAGKTKCSADGAIEELDYSYIEGTYHNDIESFWNEVASYISYSLDDEPETTFEEFVESYTLSFLSEDELNEVKKIFDENKQNC